MDNAKTVVYLGSLTTTANPGLTWPANIGGEVYSGYAFMDVIGVVNTFTGTSTPNISFYVQEYFPVTPGVGTGFNLITTGFFLNTGKASNISGTGRFYITHEDNNGTGDYANGSAKNALLGRGRMKQIVTTVSGSISAVNVDIVAVFWNP